jgi:hypothetical protein
MIGQRLGHRGRQGLPAQVLADNDAVSIYPI